jgi:hypothetical protein
VVVFNTSSAFIAGGYGSNRAYIYNFDTGLSERVEDMLGVRFGHICWKVRKEFSNNYTPEAFPDPAKRYISFSAANSIFRFFYQIENGDLAGDEIVVTGGWTRMDTQIFNLK